MSLSTREIQEVKRWLEAQLDAQLHLPFPREDLVGDVILRLLVVSAREPIGSPVAYARAILQNLIRDRIRELERARRALEILARKAVAAAPGHEESESLQNGELVSYLLEHTEFSPCQAAVIRLMYQENLSVADVAKRLSKNPGTIQRHHDRAIQKLAARAASLRLES